MERFGIIRRAFTAGGDKIIQSAIPFTKMSCHFFTFRTGTYANLLVSTAAVPRAYKELTGFFDQIFIDHIIGNKDFCSDKGSKILETASAAYTDTGKVWKTLRIFSYPDEIPLTGMLCFQILQ